MGRTGGGKAFTNPMMKTPEEFCCGKEKQAYTYVITSTRFRVQRAAILGEVSPLPLDCSLP